MTVTQSASKHPPEAELQFDIGATDDSLERMAELFARHGDIYRVMSPTRKAYTYVIHHPDDVKRVLVSNHRNYTKGLGLDRVKILLGKGIMTSEGELWRRQRYMMQPFFHRRVVTQFAATLDAVNERFSGRWDEYLYRGELLNVTEEMSQLTLDIVLSSIFGRDLPELAPHFEVVTRESGRNLQFAFKFRSLTRVVAELIERRRTGNEEHFDYVGMLMSARDRESGKPMSERELIDEIMTLVVAGHETTASALNWTWWLLSQYPEVEARLHAEVDAAPEFTSASLEQMESLQYTQQVINEALRLYPPGWMLSRRTIGADVLSGYDIPPATNILLPLYLLHRHPRYWQDPERFWPERFAPDASAGASGSLRVASDNDAAAETPAAETPAAEATSADTEPLAAGPSKRPRFAYMPFAAGPRHCIGETLALYEMLMHLYKMARRYRLIYVPRQPLELEAQINLRTRYPLYMRLERR